ncbi:CheW-like protein [Candidatus Vecturithrix granuli]|uniref:Chemotaxis protein CheW n=1 Tax=Vecturithrix granuli TaxID=1499967 RepID=A0A081BXI3_VECG1|nr:CheW-like protein [Candidatus Vecturithrix granuli]
MEETTHIHNCWKRIGVWGQVERLTCPLLEQVIHCRNCQVFTQAGRQLLERNLPQEYRNDWTGVLAQKKEEELIGTLSVVIFRIEREWLAISTHLFEEIMSADQIQSLLHRIPHRKNPVLMGMINVHGEIWLCVSLRELLGIERLTDQEETRNISKRMMVINSDDGRWVFPVDEIHGISRVHASTFQNVPVTVVKAKSTFTKGIFEWQEKRVAFLDEDLLLYSLTRSVK